ncbi:MAG: DUF975 family protein [Bacillota bacterium]|nr:DUF975 family protein [Bacillota bacterium]
MPQKSYYLKRRAKEQLSGNWIQAGIVCIITWFLTIALIDGNPIHTVQNVWHNGELIQVPTTHSSSGFGSLLSFILMGPVTLGVSGFFLKLIRNERPAIEDMFGGFKFFIQAFVLNFLITLFTILWSLLLIIPGIIAALRYSMSYYILKDNPNLTAFEALNQSKHLMVGFKFGLFRLYLSYIGWFLLGVITLGIAFIWVTPYFKTAKANFYQDLINNQKYI